MVKTLNVSLDDDTHQRLKRIKEERNLTWAEFLEAAAEALEDE